MSEYILGYVASQIIRKTVGSPAVNFVFGDVSEAVMIDNLGSSIIYFKFDGTATTGSDSGIVPANSFRSFDIKCGSISIMGSGLTSPIVQCIRGT